VEGRAEVKLEPQPGRSWPSLSGEVGPVGVHAQWAGADRLTEHVVLRSSHEHHMPRMQPDLRRALEADLRQVRQRQERPGLTVKVAASHSVGSLVILRHISAVQRIYQGVCRKGLVLGLS